MLDSARRHRFATQQKRGEGDDAVGLGGVETRGGNGRAFHQRKSIARQLELGLRDRGDERAFVRARRVPRGAAGKLLRGASPRQRLVLNLQPRHAAGAYHQTYELKFGSSSGSRNNAKLATG